MSRDSTWIPFPATTWSLVNAAKDPESPDYLAAMNRLISVYWKPVFCFIRARGYPAGRAEDLVQDFFLRLLERDWLDPADERRGRFRNFILKILTRFLSDMGPRRSSRQVQFENSLVSVHTLINDDERSYEPPDHETPEAIFDRQWANALVTRVCDDVKRFYEETGRSHWYDVFATLTIDIDNLHRPTQEELGTRFNMTRDQVRYAVEQVSKRFERLLRAELRDQTESEGDIEEELMELRPLVARLKKD